jgi:hypothetical protein
MARTKATALAAHQAALAAEGDALRSRAAARKSGFSGLAPKRLAHDTKPRAGGVQKGPGGKGAAKGAAKGATKGASGKGAAAMPRE